MFAHASPRPGKRRGTSPLPLFRCRDDREGNTFNRGRVGLAFSSTVGDRSVFSKISEGDGIAQAVDGRNAVLPLAPRGPAEKIDGPRLDSERRALKSRALPPA